MLGLAGTLTLDCFKLLGYGIALPPVIHFASKELKAKMRDVVEGRKAICLAITEPYAGLF